MKITRNKKQKNHISLDFLFDCAKIIFTIVLFFFTSINANAQCASSGSNPDTDGDGFANSCDTDSDNDGISDIVEGRYTCINSVTTSMNTVPYSFNTLFNAAQTTTPVTINNLSNGTLNFSAALVGTATWGAASGTSGNANRAGGVQIKDNFSAVGDYIYLQPINTRTNNTGAAANTSNYAVYTMQLPYKTDGFQFISAGLNSDDAYEIYAFNGATPIPLNPSNLSNFSPALGTAGTWTVYDLGDGLKITNAVTTGGANVDANFFTTTIPGEVTRIEIRSYKNLTGTNSNTVTTGITSMIYCSDYSIVDSDGDGVPNYLDLDSDNDGCSDANEYYNSASADGGDGGVYGTGTPGVDSEGKVTTASYTGNYANVIVATQLNITSHPSNSAVNVGANTTFAITATGRNTTTFSGGIPNYNVPPATNTNAGLVYQWQMSTNNGSTWANVNNGGQYSGATTSSLSVNNITIGQNEIQFRAIVSHSGKICPIISNSAQITVLQANIGIDKIVDNTTPAPGDSVTFTLTAENAGPNDANGVEVTDILPNGYTFVSAAPGVGTFNPGTGVWVIGTLNNGTNATMTITATVNATGNYANTATITSNLYDPIIGNNTSTSTPVVSNNHAPIAQNNTYSGLEDAASITGNVITDNDPVAGVDSDIDSAVLTVQDYTIAGITGIQAVGSPVAIPGVGQITILANGSLTFVPAANYNGPVPTITYTLTDGALTDTADVVITVNAVNDNPVAVDDTYTVAEDSTVNLNPLALDTDADGDTLTITSINGTALTGAAQSITVPNGTVNISAAGVITFTPDVNFNSGTAISFPYVISDGNGGTATANQLITVTAVNDTPVAQNNAYSGLEDATSITGNIITDTDAVAGVDSDIDSAVLTVQDYTIAGITGIQAVGSPVAIPGVGNITILANGSLTFVPAANYNGTVPTITYTLTDGVLTDTADVVITVNAVNDNPVAVDDTYTVAEDSTVNLNPLALDTDADGDTLTITSINGTALTGAAQSITVPNGTVNISAAGVITFTPDVNFNSGTAISFPYVISDGNGGTATANQLITVNAVNDAPVAQNNAYSGLEDAASITGNIITDIDAVAGVDSDIDSTVLTVQDYTIAGITGIQAVGSPVAIPGVGQITILANGSITFVPAANYNGTVPTITYTLTDGALTDTADVVITVNAVNDAPIAQNNAYSGLEDAASITGNVITDTDPVAGVDSDIDSAVLTVQDYTIAGITGIQAVGSPVAIPGVGNITILANGSMTFVPAANYNGTVPTITYTLTDGALTDTADVVITVNAVNDAPVAQNNAYSGLEDAASITGNVITDIDAVAGVDSDIDSAVFTVQDYTIAGITGTQSVGSPVAIPGVGNITILADGSLTFVPAANYNGTVPTITYTLTDGALTDTADIVITVNAVNDAPVAQNNSYSGLEDAASIIGNIITDIDAVAGVDSDIDSAVLTVQDYTIAGITGTQSVGSPVAIPGVGNITILANGSMTFVPASNYNGTVPTITYTLTDGVLTDTADVVITVNAVNDAPIALDDTNTPVLSTAGPTLINALTATDIDGTIVSYTIVSLPAHGVLALSGVPVTANQILTPAEAAQLTYDPNGAFVGNDTFTFTATDNEGGIDASPALITLIIEKALLQAVADPVKLADGINGSLEVVNVLDNDTLNGNPLVPSDVIVTGVNLPNGISLNADGTIDVAPITAAGQHTITYQICEVANPSNCSTATAEIFVEVPAIAIVKTGILNDSNGNGYAEAGETLTYSFTITNKGNVDLENIVVSDPLPGIIMSGGPINLAVGESNNFSITGTYTLTQSDVNSGSISNQATVSGITQSGISVSDKSDFSDDEGERPTILELSGCVIKIFNAVSANGDEKNKKFYVQGLECYPDNTVQIYNRWGVLVFERDHYNNNDIAFTGVSEGRATIKTSDGLPEGTYYYVVRYKDKQSNPQQKAGYLYLTK
ncbi:Ig-like domain-containing protein [Flavobacterium hibisci]|uniref:Ig-like domain-containing protein n=1 Tax=Flavobacterium hibisci TaxID=1914462 RepID=UPI001CC0F202|nr:Ig-like domain-containing protein [Flavobacterium hibisci]MBZ4041245.1 tandem-95 repeat protein [Flavobacterium hibisci]